MYNSVYNRQVLPPKAKEAVTKTLQKLLEPLRKAIISLSMWL